MVTSRVKYILGITLLISGVIAFAVGLSQYKEAQAPNVCIAAFAKSLGGKSSLEFDQLIQEKKFDGVVGMSVGTIFFLAGGVLVLRVGKNVSIISDVS